MCPVNLQVLTADERPPAQLISTRALMGLVLLSVFR